ncbi:hypothetical protein F53441_1774 [Fusarium austroafricanum]|uniref:RING-type domain-containing protein n=1 Tax=Fusarium austroafricanum TaxID=2364996 RepID=A0A8H4KUN4_9HYPO|nr:hypothetical protein F53441_1774 [Fusarium austroafricanum]
MMAINSLLNPETQLNEPMETTTYWPNLRDALIEDPSLFNQLRLDCGICFDEMSVFPHQHTYDPDMGYFSHRARILPCGHIFGSKCVHALVDQAIETDSNFTCMPMPASIEAVYTFPPALSEGGILPDQCGDCQVCKIVTGLAHLLPTFLFPFDLPDRDVLVVQATTMCSTWRTQPVRPGYGCDDHVEEFPMGESFRGICNMVKQRLSENATKSWISVDLAGLELSIQRYRFRDNEQRAPEGWAPGELQRFVEEVVDFIEEHID